MNTEPTNEDLDKIEETEVKPLDFVDRLVYLKNGTVVISRIVNHADSADNLVLFKPAQIISQLDGSMMMGDWLPETDDDYVAIPTDIVMATANPKKDILTGYHGSIGVTLNAYLPEGETLH